MAECYIVDCISLKNSTGRIISSLITAYGLVELGAVRSCIVLLCLWTDFPSLIPLGGANPCALGPSNIHLRMETSVIDFN